MVASMQDDHIENFPTQFMEYQRRTGVADQKGTNFEIKMSALIYLRALRGSKPFRLAVNDASAGDFDDIVYSSKVGNTSSRLLIQLKHRTVDVSKEMLSSASGKFSLNKFFRSVQKDILTGRSSNDMFLLFTNVDVNGEFGFTSGALNPDVMELITTGGSLGKVLSVDIDNDLWSSFKDEPGALEFTKRFFIICNQASVYFLDEFIKQEFIKFSVGCITNYNVLLSVFLNKIEDWWGKTGITHYLSESWEEWEEIRLKLISRGTFLFPEIKFNDDVLSQFARMIIDSKSRVVYIKYNCSNSFVRSVKVLQALSKPGGPAFVFAAGTDAEGSLAVAATGLADLIVIELSEGSFNPLFEEALRIERVRKIIVVSGNSHGLSPHNNRLGNYQEINDSFTFSQLNETSQQVVLQRHIIFQGVKIKLQDLNAQHILKNDLLISLIVSKYIEIGLPLSQGNTTYMSRSVCRNIILKKDVLSAHYIEALFYVADVSYEGFNNMITPQCENLKGRNRFIRITNGEIPNIISRLENTERLETDSPVHILQMRDAELYWLRSYGDNHQLCNYIDAETQDIPDVEKLIAKCKTCMPMEENLVDADLKTIVITGEPGIGKSVLLARVASRLKELHPDHWVIVVKLSENLNILQRLSSQCEVSSSDLLDILCTAAGVQESALGMAFLSNAVGHTGRAFVLCDAFDEISPKYSETVFSLLKLVQQSKVRMLFVTSRRMIEKKLENELQTRIFVLQPFTEVEVSRFFTQFWGEARALKVVKKLNDSFHFDDGIPVSSFPLHMKMILEAYNEIVLTDKFSELPKVLNINDLLEKFTETKLKIFYGEKSEIKGVGSDSLMDIHRRSFMDLHMYCSLKVLNICEELPPQLRTEVARKIEYYLKDVISGKEKTGIIDGVVDGNPQFIHRLFAEYFAGLWIAEHKYEVTDFIYNTYFTSWFSNVYDVFNRVLAKGCPAHIAVLNRDFSEIKTSTVLSSMDAGGRTPLHLAVQQRDQQIVKLLLDRDSDLHCHDNILNLTPLYYAIETGAWDVAVLLLKRGALVKENILNLKSVRSLIKKLPESQVAFLDEFSSGFEINWPVFEKKETILHVAARHGSKTCVKDLIKHGANMNAKNVNGSTPLHTAVDGENVAIVRLLLSYGADPSVPDVSSTTPLHRAVLHQSLDIVKLLLKFGAFTTVVDKYGDTLLHKTAIRGNSKTVKLLIEQGVPISALNRDGNTALHESVLNGNLKAVKAMLANGVPLEIPDKFDSSPLHKAAINGAPETAKLLLDRGASLLCRNSFGNTPLYSAVRWHQRKVTMLLLERGAPVDCINENGNTALHQAIRQQDVRLMQLLLQHGASVNISNNYGCAPLHTAVFWKNFTAVKLLLDAGAVTDTVDKNGDSPLHVAVRWHNVPLTSCRDLYKRNSDFQFLKRHHPRILNHLLSSGALVSLKNVSGNTPLHEAAKWQDSNTVKSLLEHGASINEMNNNSSSPLHVAARWDNHTVAQILIDAGAEINAVDNNGDTPLHVAARWNKWRMLELLLKCGADHNKENSFGERALHMIQSKGKNAQLQNLLEGIEIG